nr:integrase, catalytic region, zinc finger, CCHC-type, peptidase aspartic, catalytic [Tanacetum cinerariifolium]
YVEGLPDMIQGSVMAFKPKIIQESIEFATKLMDQKIHTFAGRQAENKKSLMTTQGTIILNNNPSRSRMFPRIALQGRSLAANSNNQRNFKANQMVVTCFECGVQGHYKKDCPKLKNNKRGNQDGNGGAQARAYAVGKAGKNPDANVGTGNVMINRVYYVEGLNHNLFTVGQFCDADLKVAFRKSTCFVRDLHAKRSSFKSKAVTSLKGRLNLLHMDLCGPMWVASINGKKYILVIIDDYSRDGENLDKMKEKRDPCILVGYSTQSKGYRVYNKRTRMIVESIHIRFDEIKEVLETFVANNTSGLVPQRQKASDYDNPAPVPQRQDVSSLTDVHVPSQQELDLLFGPLYDEFFNAGSTLQ